MPISSKPIQVNLSGTGAIAGQVARVINRNTGEIHPLATSFSANKRLVFDCADFASGWTAGDVIEVQTSGGAYGTALITLTASGAQTASLSATAESATLPKGGN